MTTSHGLVAVLGVALLSPARAAADAATTTNDARSTTDVTVEISAPTYDAYQALLDDEARAAMNAGDFHRAWYLFWRLLEIDPHDARALREAGRVAQALGHFGYAADAFARVELLVGKVADPEIHYLRGEALHALGRGAEAEREWALCERELAAQPPDRRGTLWLARIAALRGNLAIALAYYDSLLPASPYAPAYVEVRLLAIEALTLSKRWATAERQLRDLLRVHPNLARGRALLAWVLDARGEVDEALRLRAAFADEWTEHPRKTLEYARALERVFAYSAALVHYREARALGAPAAADIDRLEHRLSPELAGGATVRGDASGGIVGWMAGATLPLGGRRRLALTAVSEASRDGLAAREATSSSVAGWGVLTSRRGLIVALGASGRYGEHGAGIGGSGLVFTRPDRRVQLQVRGDLQQPWRESSSTVREGGVVDAATAQVFAAPRAGRVLVSLGLQARRLGLAPMPSEPSRHALQGFVALGADYTLTSDPTRAARGEILDGELLAPRALASSTILSYRHYELVSEDPFGERLVLVERSSIDEVSGALRRLLDRRGRVGVELRAGVGYDWRRDIRLLRGGASLLVSATAASRLTLDLDVANESRTGLVGRRHAGSVVLHVDL